MIFAQIPVGDVIFLDANTFVYHFAPDPKYQAACSQLLHRIENQDVLGYTSTAILSELGRRQF
jgi:predicted nucleic acid-binding protein